MAERQVLSDPIGIGGVHHSSAAQSAATFSAFGLVQMPTSGVGTKDLAACGDLEPFGHGFSGLIASRATHNLFEFL